jgi:hypothetical protein
LLCGVPIMHFQRSGRRRRCASLFRESAVGSYDNDVGVQAIVEPA